MSMPIQEIKCVVVGDGNVGKSSMLQCYADDKSAQEYVPSVVDNFSKSVNVDGVPIVLNLWDTIAQEDYDRVRPLSYPLTNIFLVCFSLTNRDSYENVKQKWEPEIHHHCPLVPCILVGTKTDLRYTFSKDRQKSKDIVTTSEGLALKKKINAMKYVECSALTRKGIKHVFDETVCVVNAQHNHHHYHRPCLIL